MTIDFKIELVDQVEDKTNDSIDVLIRFDNGEEYVGTFITLKNVEKIISKNRVSGEQLGGKYFWISDMIILEEIDEPLIIRAIEDLINTHGFYLALSGANDLGRRRIFEETNHSGIGEVITPPIDIKIQRP